VKRKNGRKITQRKDPDTGKRKTVGGKKEKAPKGPMKLEGGGKTVSFKLEQVEQHEPGRGVYF